MFWRQNKKEDKSNDILEKIKSELELQLGNRGVTVSGIKMQLNPGNISLRIYIDGSKRLA
ncbi:hypothetical protein CLHUN_30340 [Ruminiclostridium hungatei]|uniref:Ribosome-binding factor A n=1 Tax=Ruminiclostridium hungatei TaxID=48256 RepID=A0A1V4SGN4_RUMHU|nr:hypothetical protein [Ruminiclostridium hungatei]OPX43092.1 hypothetical protein CLHUN_30340 [Ruminiclostridium hungatei]